MRAQPEIAAASLPETMCAASTVGVIYDDTEGLTFLADYARVQDAFADPGLARDPAHRHAVLGYLRDPNITVMPLRRLAAADPDRASLLFARLLNKRGFDWHCDGETLLRRHKPGCFTHPPLPHVVPLGDALARAVQAA